MTKQRIIAPYCYVILGDGAELEVQSTNWDMLQWERHARQNRLPAATDGAAVEAMTFIAWHALKREAQIPADVPFEQFARDTVSINTKRVAQDPTPPDREDDS